MKCLALMGLAAIGVAVGCHTDRSSAPIANALIQDATHHNGNTFFTWLAPLVQQEAPAAQVFSRQLSPAVTITNLCTGVVIRTFAGSDVQIEDGQYHANWHTPDDNLDPNCHYRIETKTGTRQLGVADVDVVDDGSELRSVDTDEFIPLRDDRTLPIKFFIGVGSQCERADSDCGEGIAQPGVSTTIVTKNGRAGVLIPAGAVDQPVTIIIESANDRPCIPGLPEPVFPGSIGPIGNSCYDFHTEPPLTEVNALGKFNTKVTVGICADIDGLDHVTQDLLQIFQLHIGATSQIFALNNVPAPFLTCDPAFTLPVGSRRSLLTGLASALRSLIAPRPLFASTKVAFDLGAGGSTEVFSRFTWALPSLVDLNFDQAPDLSAIAPGALVNTLFARQGITFSRTNTLGLCPGTGVYANNFGMVQNNISTCPLGIPADFSAFGAGAIKATFAVPAAQACITATPTGFHLPLVPGGVAYIEALNAAGNVLSRTESSTQRVPQQLCVQGTGITAVRFAGKGTAFAIFDNLRWAR